MRKSANNFYMLLIFFICLFVFGSFELKAQSAEGRNSTSSGGNKVLQDIELNTVSIKYKVQTPRVKFTMERLPVDIKIDYEKLESLRDVVNQQPKKLIFMSKKFEEATNFSPSRVIEHTISGAK